MTRMTDKAAPRVTIIHHADVRLMLMRQKAWAEGMRALVLYAASQQDAVELPLHHLPRSPARGGDASRPWAWLPLGPRPSGRRCHVTLVPR